MNIPAAWVSEPWFNYFNQVVTKPLYNHIAFPMTHWFITEKTKGCGLLDCNTTRSLQCKAKSTTDSLNLLPWNKKVKDFYQKKQKIHQIQSCYHLPLNDSICLSTDDCNKKKDKPLRFWGFSLEYKERLYCLTTWYLFYMIDFLCIQLATEVLPLTLLYLSSRFKSKTSKTKRYHLLLFLCFNYYTCRG